MPIKIEFLSDVVNVIRGARQTEGALEDVAGSLDDVGTSGEKLDAKVSDSFKRMADEAQTSGKKAKAATEDASRGAHEAVTTMGEEARSNLSETVSSFRGDVEDLPQLMQDIAGGVVSDLGPAGMIAGTALAAGIGLSVAALMNNAEEVAKNKELVLDLAGAIDEAGGNLADVDFESRMQEWGRAIQDTKEWWELFQDDAKTGFEVIQDQSRKAGTEWTSAFRGAQGSMDDAQAFLDSTADSYQKLNDDIEAAGVTADEYGRLTSNASQATQDQKKALEEQRQAAQDNIGTQQAALKVEEDGITVRGAATRTLGGQTAAQKREEDATRRATDAKREQYDAIAAVQDAQDRAAGKVKDAITAENDLAAAWDDSTQALKDNGATVDVNTEKGRANRQMLVDLSGKITDSAAAQIAQGQSIEDATAKMEEQRGKFIDTAVAAGMGEDAAAQLADQLGLTPAAVETKFQSNVADEKRRAEEYTATLNATPANIKTDINLNGIPDAEEKLRAFINVGRHISVDVRTGDVSAVDNYIEGMNGKRINVDIAPRGGFAIAP